MSKKLINYGHFPKKELESICDASQIKNVMRPETFLLNK